MGFASLLKECIRLGVNPDIIAKLTEDNSDELTEDQVLELRLEKVLLSRKLELSEERRITEVQDVRKQLAAKQEEASVRIHEIKYLNDKLAKKEEELSSQLKENENLKVQIQKLKKSGSEGPQVGVMNSDESEDVDVYDWAGGQIARTSGTGSDQSCDGQTQSTEITLELESAGSERSPDDDDDDDGISIAASASEFTEQDPQAFSPVSSTEIATSNRDYSEDMDSEIQMDEDFNRRTEEEGSSNDLDDILSSENEDTPTIEDRTVVVWCGVPQSGTSSQDRPSHQIGSPASLQGEPRGSRIISSPPDGQSYSTQAGSSSGQISQPSKRFSFSCSGCPKQCSTKQHLQKHIFSVHSNDPGVFKCERCRLGYFCHDEFKRHENRCDSSKLVKSQWPCRHCSRMFISYSARYYHERSHDGNRCPGCSKQYSSKQMMQKHIFSVHSNDPGVFKCGRCHLGYFCRLEFERHVERCDPSKPENDKWPCKYCSKLFNSRTARYLHEKTHDGRNDNKTNGKMCGRSFANVSLLPTHENNQHSQRQ